MKQFNDRVEEVNDYIAFLEGIDSAFKFGSPCISRLDGKNTKLVANITPNQQKMLYSSVYLQLYNLIESTITNSLCYISKITFSENDLFPCDLSDEIRNEWIRYIAKTNEVQPVEKRLEGALALFNHFIDSLPVASFDIKSGSGNLSQVKILKIAKRLGCELNIDDTINERVKRHRRDDKGATELVVSLRNDLAHGKISFVNCGQSDTAKDLKDLVESISDYLKEVVNAFVNYIEAQKYLIPKKRKLKIL